MNYQNKLTSSLRSLALGAGLAVIASTGFAQTYSVTDLGVLPDKKESYSAGINSSGQVIGRSTTADPSDSSAFRYGGNGKVLMEDLSRKFTGSTSRGFGINDSGTAVGDFTFFGRGETSRHAAIFRNGSIADLGTLKQGGNFSRANGINDVDQVVGSSSPTLDGEKSRAFIWSGSTGMVDIGTLGGDFADAYAINNSGFVTGNSQTRFNRQAEATHAFLAQPLSRGRVVRAMQDLGTLGGNFSTGLSINGANHVVGYSTLNDLGEQVHAFFYDGRKMHDLGSLAGSDSDIHADQSVALGINKHDEIVGYTFAPSDTPGAGTIDPITHEPQQVAFVYSNGTMTNLNRLIGTAAKRYLIYSATGINERGQIAASAFDTETGSHTAVLLTPISDSSFQK